MASKLLENLHKLAGEAVQLPRAQPLAPPTELNLCFWGTRGSIPVSGPEYWRYGGNTSCVSLTSDTGHLFIFDCGSGARDLGNMLLEKQPVGQPLTGYMLISHTHWDHIQGFPFFGPVFRAGNRFNVLGWSNGSQNLAQVMAGQMEQYYFPISLCALPADLTFHSVTDHQQILLDGAKLTTQLLKHPLPSVAYRLELGGRSIVYATDHEPLKLPDPQPDRLLTDSVIDRRLVNLARNADVLIHDAQYTAQELCDKVGWGHSSVEVAVDTAIKAGVKHLVLYHHDPIHSDILLDDILTAARDRAAALSKNALHVSIAGDGLRFEIQCKVTS